MNLTAHPGPRKTILPSLVGHSQATVSVTLREPLKKSPFADTDVKLSYGSLSWDTATDSNGVVTLCFYNVGPKEKLPDGTLKIEVGGYPETRLACALYPNALISHDVYLPPVAFASSSFSTSPVNSLFVQRGSIRTVALHTPGLSGNLSVESQGNRNILVFPLQFPNQVQASSSSKNFSFRGTGLGESLSLKLRHASTGTESSIEAHVVSDASEEVEARKGKLLQASKCALDDGATLTRLNSLVKKLKKKDNLPEKNEDSEEDEDWADLEAPITLQAFLDQLIEYRVFLIGESHDNPKDLEVVWQIISGLHAPPHRKVRLLFEQIPHHDLRRTVGAKAGIVDFTTGMKALNEGKITPALFDQWCDWSAFWSNHKEDEKILTLLGRAIAAGIEVSGFDLPREKNIQIGDLQRDPFMTDLLSSLLDTTEDVLVTINGTKHLLGDDAVNLLGIGRLLREKGKGVITLRPRAGDNDARFTQRTDTDDYRFSVRGYDD